MDDSESSSDEDNDLQVKAIRNEMIVMFFSMYLVNIFAGYLIFMEYSTINFSHSFFRLFLLFKLSYLLK